jgi:hypothetical protein
MRKYEMKSIADLQWISCMPPDDTLVPKHLLRSCNGGRSARGPLEQRALGASRVVDHPRLEI